MSINEQVKLKEDNCFTSAFNALFFASFEEWEDLFNKARLIICIM